MSIIIITIVLFVRILYKYMKKNKPVKKKNHLYENLKTEIQTEP